jgi:hypothetical protein
MIAHSSGIARPRRPEATASRHIIVFVAADPGTTSRIALEAQCDAIAYELRATTGRDDFDLRTAWAADLGDVARHLDDCRPSIIHVSGCCGAGAQCRAPCMTERPLAQIIATAAPSTRVVMLDSCFSDAVATPLCDVVDCVVGITGGIGSGARSFAVGFYRALGNRRSIRYAIAHAVSSLAARRLRDDHLPVYRTRDGVSADHIFLSSPGCQVL